MAKNKRETVSLSKLLLDNENPRHDPIDNESDIIAQLVKSERVVELARNIAETRGTSPLEIVGVLPHGKTPGFFTVAEGNRRVCALKLLRDPGKAPTAKHRKIFEALKEKSGALPDKIEVVRFADIAEANLWKSLRHQGEQGGIGTRAWGAEEKARHAGRSGVASNANVQAVQLLDYAAKAKLIGKDERAKISVTTVTRYLSNPVVRNALGIASTRELATHAPGPEFDRAVQHFLLDAVPREGEDTPVNSRSNKQDREAYAADLHRRGVATKTRLPTAVTPSAAAAAAKGRNNRGADKRPFIVPAQFSAHIRDLVLKRLFDELRKIEPGEFSFAGGYLLRAFMERLAHRYASDHGLGTSGDLHAVIGRCARHLEQQQQPQRVTKPLNVMASDKHSRLSPDTLGAWVHGSEIPTAAELKRRWESLEASIRVMLDALK